MIIKTVMKILTGFSIFWRRWLAILLFFITVIILNSCNPVHLKTKDSQLVVSYLTDPKTFNPALVVELTHILPYTYEGLVKENDQGKLEPCIAESWKFSKDYKKIVFLIRKGLKWSDGVPLTADDVVFTYNEIYKNPAIPSYAKDFLKMGKNRAFPTVRKLDDFRVEFTLPEPWFPFLRITKMEILPAHALREAVNTKNEEGQPKFLSTWGTDTAPEKIIVNGPYKIETYQPGERIIFRKNPYYWRKDLQGNRQPYIDRVIWNTVKNTDTALLQFRSGGLDFIDVHPDYFSLLKQEEKRGKFTIYNNGPSLGSTVIAFNLNKGSRNGKPLIDPIKSRWFNTLEFRQAVAYGIDRQQILNNVYRGLGELQNSPLSVNSPYYLSEKAGLKVYEYNPQKAKELLLKAGFQYTKVGQLLDEQGNPVRFTLITDASNKVLQAMAVQVKQDLARIGISVDFNPVSLSLFLEKINFAFDWECTVLTTIVGIEPNEWANIWLPSGRWHFFNQQSPSAERSIMGREVAKWEQKIGDLYIQAAGEFDEEKRKALYGETQRISQNYLPFIYLVNPLSMLAVRNRIQGVKPSPYVGTYWNIYEMKLKE
ncbi:putative periplasmic component of ABC-type transport system [Planktothrix tepida PCC 9214]|uniref:Putative periplasmic component of ABC-type transport system n=1 Tax=Planktothrix tepida PCC 9214 TaxID=671072 RepID=A0A1J1LRP2_9CYAN|nr:ABC transporter substrate-binding protein [Planktothrix tepida]CUR35071.1 putative periplasmic component of ABC-type transport system [Planktothrix tepida PCC 9214]